MNPHMYRIKHKVEDRSQKKKESQEGINTTQENHSLTTIWTCLREDKKKKKKAMYSLPNYKKRK